MATSDASPARGRWAEILAAVFLEMRGFAILDRNRRAAGGEIDIVARRASELIFVEVRLRSAGAWVDAGRSIDARKRLRLRSCARALSREPGLRWRGRSMRFDIVLIQLSGPSLQLEHLENVRL